MIIGIEKAAAHLFDLEKWAGKFSGGARLLKMKPLTGAPKDLARLAGGAAKPVKAPTVAAPAKTQLSTPAAILKPSVIKPIGAQTQRKLDKLPNYISAATKAGHGDNPIVRILADVAAGRIPNTDRVAKIIENGIPQILELIRRSLNSVRTGKYTDFFGG